MFGKTENYTLSLIQVPQSDGALTCPRGKDMTIINCHNILPNRKWDRSELSGSLTSYPVGMFLRIWGFWKRFELRFTCWSEQLAFSDLMRSDKLGSWPVEMSWDLRNPKMRCALVGSQHRMVCIGFYKLYLSPRVANDWRQKK